MSNEPFGPYRLIAWLARGGMAEIHLAVRTGEAGFEKLVVIKRILPALSGNPIFINMFLQEARLAALLNHPNVVQVFDSGQIDGHYYIAMEYLSGESLATILDDCRRSGRRLPPDLTTEIILRTAEGLHHAHTRTGIKGEPLNMVHRDVNPSNIFVLYDGGVKLVDFGIAKATRQSDRSQTRTGFVKGKVAYLSPEQAFSEPLDCRSDVFSLGAVLWECLTGRSLYARDNDLASMEAITRLDAPSPASIVPGVPDPLCRIALKALARNRTDRFESAAAMRAALSDCLRSTGQTPDTAGLAAFMHGAFPDHKAIKQKLIEGALTGEWRPNSTWPGTGQGKRPDGLRSGAKRWLMALLCLLGLAAGLGIWMSIAIRPAPETTVVAAPEFPPQPIPPATSLPREEPREVNLSPSSSTTAGPAARPRRRSRKRPPKTGPSDGKHATAANRLTGKLRLMTTPWTHIYFQGRFLGTSPLVDVELPAGPIELRAVNREAGIDATIHLRIKAGERLDKRHSFL